MRAGIYCGPGKIALAERPLPEPGPGEVRLRITACGLCGTDLHMVHSPHPIIDVGSTMGHEMAGTVDDLGQGVSGFVLGEPVVVEPLASCGDCEPCREGRDSICRKLQLYGLRRPGGFADAVVVPAHRLYRVPHALDPVLAALAEPFAVAIHGLRLSGAGKATPPARLLILGTGAIGLAVAAVARAWGFGQVAITARYPHQARLARRLGAHDVLDAGGAEDLAGLDADLVVETVGGHADTMTAAGIALAPGGTICVLGVFLGPLTLDSLAMLGKEARLQWSNCYARHPGEADFAEAVRILVAGGDTYAELLSHKVQLDEIERAFEIAGDKGSGAIKVTVTP